MFWFGYRPFSLMCTSVPRAETPTGDPCLWCEEPIGPDEDGYLIPYVESDRTEGAMPWHMECHLRFIAGGVHHQMGTCMCYGGALRADPADLTIREAARLAAELFATRRYWRQ